MTSRTPPPTPEPPYRLTLFDRHGASAALVILGRFSVGAGGVIGGALSLLAALMLGEGGGRACLSAVAGAAGGGALVWVVTRVVSGGAGAAFQAVLWPSGASCPPPADYSRQEALVARGDVAGALAAYEALLAEHPERVGLRLRIADLRAAGDHERASAQYRDVQRRAVVRSDEWLRATNRLVDLYLGPMCEPARAMPELRRLADAYPDGPIGVGALSELNRLKVQMLAEYTARRDAHDAAGRRPRSTPYDAR